MSLEENYNDYCQVKVSECVRSINVQLSGAVDFYELERCLINKLQEKFGKRSDWDIGLARKVARSVAVMYN